MKANLKALETPFTEISGEEKEIKTPLKTIASPSTFLFRDECKYLRTG